jgi:hypothetical protein
MRKGREDLPITINFATYIDARAAFVAVGALPYPTWRNMFKVDETEDDRNIIARFS